MTRKLDGGCSGYWNGGSVQAAVSSQPGVAASSNVIDFDELDAPVQMVEQEFDPSLLITSPPGRRPQLRSACPPPLWKRDSGEEVSAGYSSQPMWFFAMHRIGISSGR